MRSFSSNDTAGAAVLGEGRQNNMTTATGTTRFLYERDIMNPFARDAGITTPARPTSPRHHQSSEPGSPVNDAELGIPLGKDARWRYVSRRAAAMGSRAARMAGKRPPSRPMAAAQMIAATSSFGVTAKAKATWLKVWKLIVDVW